jgi:hypothetical protein
MQMSPVRLALHALLICSVLDAPSYAAGPGPSGGETGATIQTSERQDTGGTAGNSNRDAVITKAPLKGRETAAAGANAGSSAARAAQPAALRRDKAQVTLHSRSSLPLAHAYLWKPATGADPRANSIRSRNAAGRAVRGSSTASALAATGRPSIGLTHGTNRPGASLKAVAGNGVVGGASAPGRGTIGGPTNTATMIKAGINGTTLHRRS